MKIEFLHQFNLEIALLKANHRDFRHGEMDLTPICTLGENIFKRKAEIIQLANEGQPVGWEEYALWYNDLLALEDAYNDLQKEFPAYIEAHNALKEIITEVLRAHFSDSALCEALEQAQFRVEAQELHLKQYLTDQLKAIDTALVQPYLQGLERYQQQILTPRCCSCWFKSKNLTPYSPQYRAKSSAWETAFHGLALKAIDEAARAHLSHLKKCKPDYLHYPEASSRGIKAYLSGIHERYLNRISNCEADPGLLESIQVNHEAKLVADPKGMPMKLSVVELAEAKVESEKEGMNEPLLVGGGKSLGIN